MTHLFRIVALLSATALTRPVILEHPRIASSLSSLQRDTGALQASTMVTGTVFDSVTGAPLGGAVVQMMQETAAQRVFSASTDTLGVYRITGITPGWYRITFFHPVLAALGLEPVVHRVQIGRDSVTRVDLGVPSPLTIWRAACGPTSPNDSTGLLLGEVRDADTATPISGAQVVISWRELGLDKDGLHSLERRLVATTNATGRYAACEIPGDGPVAALAHRGMATSGILRLQVPAEGLLRRDIALGKADDNADSVVRASVGDTLAGSTIVENLPIDSIGGRAQRRGTARLAGTVRGADGTPMEGVRLDVLGAASHAESDKNGRFLLGDLPSGSYMLEARRLGFMPKWTIVDLVGGHTATVAVTLDDAAVMLDAVTVIGKSAKRTGMAGFFERRARGRGHFLTRADIERKHPFETTDLFRSIPGVHVKRSDVFNHIVRTEGGAPPIGFDACPVVYIDGYRVFREANNILDNYVDLDEIAALEIYNGWEAPLEFRGDNCGSIVIWTRPRSRIHGPAER